MAPPKKTIPAKIRPLANASLEKASLLGAARLYVSKDSLIALTGELANGKACTIEKIAAEGEEQGESMWKEACLHVLPGQNVSPNVVQMSRAFQEATGFKIGDQVNLQAGEGPVPDAEEVLVEDVSKDPKHEGKRSIPLGWEASVLSNMERAEQVWPGMIFESVAAGLFRRSFKVVSVDGNKGLANVNVEKTKPRLLQPGEADGLATGVEPRGELILTDVPGLKDQTREINAFLRNFKITPARKYEKETCALLIEGGKGTGKTFILEKLASTNWGRVFWIEESDKSPAIREKFAQARAQQPSMVIIDDVQNILSSDGTERTPVVHVLMKELDALSKDSAKAGPLAQTVVLATCRDRLKDVPERLRDGRRFFKTIVLPIPRAPERLEILRHLAAYHIREEDRESLLGKLAEDTYAYSCKDLDDLAHEAVSIRSQKMDKAYPDGDCPAEETFITREDLKEAKRHVPASLMQDTHLQPESVKWEDIGGQHDVKKMLDRMIQQNKGTKRESNVVRKPDKGLLLYGPPGCSKTLSARAMATESGFNFFSIKAGELLNMYVGESERQVREVFARAKAATPAIIFFDEIESIAKARGGGPGTTSSGGGVNTLTSLLTEMDGFEGLNGVLIIAATNKPEAIDSALMRPGRFSKVVYVGPPDLAAREAIFRVHLRGQRLAPDVDLAELAAKSEGHSGSEIEAIVRGTEQIVQDRVDEAREAAGEEAGREAMEFKMTDLLASMEDAPKTITKQVIDSFERWGKTAGFKKQDKGIFG